MKESIDTEIFKALGEPQRVKLLAMLSSCCKPCTVTEMKECCPVDFSVVSRHLKTLKDANIVRSTKKGKEVFYTLNAKYMAGLFRQLAELFEACEDTTVNNSINKNKEE